MIRLFIILLFIVLVAWMAPEADKTKEGNRLYNKELYDEAMTKYTEVLIDLPNSPRLHLNIGNAAYKKENYEEAIKSFTKSASMASDLALESKAYYNLGNCKYRQGRMKENTNLGEAISLYQEALEYYRQTLDKTPEDGNAKYNHEFVERRIKELLDQQKQESEQQGQQQEQQQEQQQGQQQSQTAEQQGQQQEQEDQSGKDDKSETEEKKAEEVKAQEEEPQEGQEQKQESGKRENLTKKEAKMLLDSLKDEELSRPDNPPTQRRIPRVLRDW